MTNTQPKTVEDVTRAISHRYLWNDFAIPDIGPAEDFIRTQITSLITSAIEQIEAGKRDAEYGMDVAAFKGTVAARSFNQAFNAAKDEDITILRSLLGETNNRVGETK